MPWLPGEQCGAGWRRSPCRVSGLTHDEGELIGIEVIPVRDGGSDLLMSGQKL